MKLRDKTRKYLNIIGKTDGCSVLLTKGFAKQAQALVNLGCAIYIPRSVGGCYVTLTPKGIAALEEKEGA